MRSKSVITVFDDFFGFLVVFGLAELCDDSLIRSLDDFRPILFRTFDSLITVSSGALVHQKIIYIPT
jgi:hypothetical protein